MQILAERQQVDSERSIAVYAQANRDAEPKKGKGRERNENKERALWIG